MLGRHSMLGNGKPITVVKIFAMYYLFQFLFFILCSYRSADKSLARPGRKQTTAAEDFEFHISYL